MSEQSKAEPDRLISITDACRVDREIESVKGTMTVPGCILPPGSRIKYVHPRKHAGIGAEKVGKILTVGMYNLQEGLMNIWLFYEESGEFAGVVHATHLEKCFEIVSVSAEKVFWRY